MNNSRERQQKLPLHMEVELELIRRIQAGEVQPGQKLATELELVTEFNVSRTTVRHALINLENQGYVQRVHGKGAFAVGEPANPARFKQNSQLIYAIVPHLTSDFTGLMVTGAQEHLFSNGYALSILPTNDNMEKEKEYLRMIIDHGALGVLLQPTKGEFYNPLVTELLSMTDIPLVMMGRYYRYVDCSYVDGHNYQGAYDVVSHLIKLGHKKIGIVSKPPLIHTSLEDRIKGYFNALIDNQIKVESRYLLLDLADNRNVYSDQISCDEKQEISNQLAAFIRANPEMTAVFALNDMIAADLMKAARECGRAVARDISIVGFDNVPLATKLEPPLTTVHAPMQELGRRAAEILLDHITGVNQAHVKEHLAMHLIIRDS